MIPSPPLPLGDGDLGSEVSEVRCALHLALFNEHGYA